SATQVESETKAMKKLLDDQGLITELVAPRLWEDARGIDGGYTANDPKVRQWALERSKRCIDIGRMLGTKIMVLWLAREGTYVREAKNAIEAHKWLLDAVNAMLDYDPNVQIAIEPKPNEPMDHAYIPTIGHALAFSARSKDPARVGGLIESAHAILAGL